jgi:hypothetical protein
MNAPNKQALLLQAGLPLRLVGWDAMSVGIRVIFSILAATSRARRSINGQAVSG